jgi:hypothetical protein
MLKRISCVTAILAAVLLLAPRPVRAQTGDTSVTCSAWSIQQNDPSALMGSAGINSPDSTTDAPSGAFDIYTVLDVGEMTNSNSTMDEYWIGEDGDILGDIGPTYGYGATSFTDTVTLTSSTLPTGTLIIVVPQISVSCSVSGIDTNTVAGYVGAQCSYGFTADEVQLEGSASMQADYNFEPEPGTFQMSAEISDFRYRYLLARVGDTINLSASTSTNTDDYADSEGGPTIYATSSIDLDVVCSLSVSSNATEETKLNGFETYVPGNYTPLDPITAVSPSSLTTDMGSFILTVTQQSGTSPANTILWNATPLRTTVVSTASGNTLQATIPAGYVAQSGVAAITLCSGAVLSNTVTISFGASGHHPPIIHPVAGPRPTPI